MGADGLGKLVWSVPSCRNCGRYITWPKLGKLKGTLAHFTDGFALLAIGHQPQFGPKYKNSAEVATGNWNRNKLGLPDYPSKERKGKVLKFIEEGMKTRTTLPNYKTELFNPKSNWEKPS